MNLYTSPENQKLLWDTISKVNLFQSIQSDKNQWFQTIIGHFYDLYKNKPFNKNDLRNLNKETITFMISKLKQERQFQPSNHSFENNFNQNPVSTFNHIQTNKNETHSFIQEKKQHELDNQFQLRQQEYGQLLSKPSAPEIDFRESVQEDKPIENMDELLERQMREREYEIQPIAKSEEIKIDTIDLGEDKKKVSWSSDIENTRITKLEEKMEAFMLSIQDKLDTLHNEIELLKNKKIEPTFENKSTTEEFLEKHFA